MLPGNRNNRNLKKHAFYGKMTSVFFNPRLNSPVPPGLIGIPELQDSARLWLIQSGTLQDNPGDDVSRQREIWTIKGKFPLFRVLLLNWEKFPVDFLLSV